MGYAEETGYVPETVEQIMDRLMAGINTQFGTSYITDNFAGTNFYKYFYALAQEVQKDETKTSEIFQKLQGYFEVINARISRPATTPNGIVEQIESFSPPSNPDITGFVASVKPMIEADAGKINICIDVDETDPDYADLKLDLCTKISQITVLGAVTQGTESEAIFLSNGQSFDFKYHLPNRVPIGLRLTITLSDNNQVLVGNPDDIKAKLLANIAARYRLGRNFEPQKYYSTTDAPWASNVLLEWTDDVTDGEVDPGATWNDEIYVSNFDDLFQPSLGRIELVEV
jgi:hypothetical protein